MNSEQHVGRVHENKKPFKCNSCNNKYLLLEKWFRKTYFHSMATANLKKSEEFVTNNTAASKYIPRRPKISIN